VLYFSVNYQWRLTVVFTLRFRDRECDER